MKNNANVRIKEFEVIHWAEQVTVERTNPETGIKETLQEIQHPILIYALGDDGVLYESVQGKWRAYPINAETVHVNRGIPEHKRS